MAAATSSKGNVHRSPVEAGWSQRELEHLSGIDPRLVRRLAIMLEDWAAQPQASIPEGSRSKAAVKASYRLLSNKRLKAADIAQSHREATWGRMASHEVVLAVADTTSFNHTTHARVKDVGPIGQGNSSAQGFFLHSVLAFSEQGEALGVLHAHTWARERDGPSRRQRQAQKNRKALDQRESHRWISAYEDIVAQREANAPAGCEALHWKLLSSIPCEDAAQVQQQLRWYARRWGIEVFHRTLKSGCQSEARRLSSLEKLRRALSLDLIVAWRLMALRDASRQQPQEPATQWLEAEECAVLSAWAMRQQKTKTQSPPSIAEAVR